MLLGPGSRTARNVFWFLLILLMIPGLVQAPNQERQTESAKGALCDEYRGFEFPGCHIFHGSMSFMVISGAFISAVGPRPNVSS